MIEIGDIVTMGIGFANETAYLTGRVFDREGMLAVVYVDAHKLRTIPLFKKAVVRINDENDIKQYAMRLLTL